MSKSANGKYYASIDGLRALAVVSVIIHHLDRSYLPSGYLGVDVFFVISGFVITGSLWRAEGSLLAFLGGFYKRRIKRLLPALVFCVFSTLALFLTFFDLEPGHAQTAGASLVGLSNIVLYFNDLDYWGGDARFNPFTHTWSLGVEEQFYFVFPFLLWLTITRKSNSWGFLAALASLSVASFLGYVFIGGDNPSAAFYLSPFRFWELGLGAIAFAISRRTKAKPGRWFGAMSAHVILVALLANMTLAFADLRLSVIIAVLLTSMLLMLIASSQLSGHTLLSTSLVVYVGKLSYSLYLWHWPIFVIGVWIAADGWLEKALQLILAGVAAALSYHLIETRFRYARWSAIVPKPAVALLVMTPLLAAVGLYAGSAQLETVLGSTKVSALGDEPEPLMTDTAANPAKQMMTIRLLGNSHAEVLEPLMKDVFSGCPVEIVVDRHGESKYLQVPSGTSQAIGLFDGVVSQLKTGDLLILASRYRHLYEVQFLNANGTEWLTRYRELKEKSKISQPENPIGLGRWLSDLDMVIKKSEQQGVNVVLFLPHVEFFNKPLPTKICSKRINGEQDPECNLTVSMEKLAERFPPGFYEEVALRAGKQDNFSAFDPMPILCPGMSTCSRYIDGQIAYADTNHVTGFGARLMSDPFRNFLLEHELVTSLRQDLALAGCLRAD